MPKGADPDAYISSVPDSTNNYKGRLGVGQFKMLPKKQNTNKSTTSLDGWNKVAQYNGFKKGTFMPYMKAHGFQYDYTQNLYYNPKTKEVIRPGDYGNIIWRGVGTNGRVISQSYNNVKRFLENK